MEQRSITLRSAQRKRGRVKMPFAQVSFHHQPYKRWESRLRLPIEFGASQGGIRTEIVDFPVRSSLDPIRQVSSLAFVNLPWNRSALGQYQRSQIQRRYEIRQYRRRSPSVVVAAMAVHGLLSLRQPTSLPRPSLPPR